MPGQFPDFDLYEELEVSPRASEEVIQAAYRRLAQTFHPDHYKGPDSGRMTRLNVAREFLSDSLKRADYDRQRPGAQAEAQARAGLQYWPDGVIASFDIETTGLSPESDEIIQVAILYIDRDGRVLPNSWTSIVNPGRPSSPQAFAVHGITDDRAAREGISAGDAAREILIRLRAVADDHIPLVVYNAPFDLGFMHVRASRFGTVLPELIVIDPLVCDRALEARRTGSRTLGAVAAYYGCTADGLHDAQNDAAVAVAIARAIAQKYPHIGQSTLIDLHRQQSIWSRGQRGAAGWPVPDRYSVGHTPDTINPNDTDPEMRLQVAVSLSARAFMHSKQYDFDTAIADVTSVIEAYSDDTDPWMRRQVAAALSHRGDIHSKQDEFDFDAAIADYTSVIETYSDDTDPELRIEVAMALSHRGFRHDLQNNLAAAIADYTSIIEIYSDDSHPEMRLLVASALGDRGDMHWEQDNLAAASADDTSVIEAYSDDSHPEMRLLVARALYDRGLMHKQQDNLAAAIADVTSVIEAYSDDPDPKMRELVAWARDRAKQDDLDAAIAEYTSLIEAYSDDTDPKMRLQVARALQCRGHDRGHDFDAAIADYTSIIETYSDDTDPEMRLQVAEALCGRGSLYGGPHWNGDMWDQSPVAAAIANYTSIIETYSDDSHPEMRLLVARALWGRCARHHQQNEYAAAIADYTSIIETYSDDTDLEMRLQVEYALEELAKFAN